MSYVTIVHIWKINKQMEGDTEAKKKLKNSPFARESFAPIVKTILENDQEASEIVKQECANGEIVTFFARKMFNMMSGNEAKRMNNNIRLAKKRLGTHESLNERKIRKLQSFMK